MSLWSSSEILEALKSDLVQQPSLVNISIDEVVIDSRKINNSSSNYLFVALKGENNDGHNYLKQIFENGAKLAIAEQIPADLQSSAFRSQILIVKNTYQALENLARYARKRSLAKIIAITGSVGKTSTKELLKLAFSSQGKTFANFGNLNNHIGVPLSLANLSADCQFAIFEMGMNHLNEITPLSKMARPHLAIITTVGPVHIEFFNNEQEIALAKSEIFAGLEPDGYAILNVDNQHYDFLYQQAQHHNICKDHILSIGQHHKADYQINEIELDTNLVYQVQALLKNSIAKSYVVGTSNISSAFNSIFAVASLDLVGNNLDKGLAILKDFECSAGRGKVSNLTINHKNITIIDDTYNASILSMKSGLENCSNLKNILGKKRKICLLGDMLELGDKALEIHCEVLKFVAEKNFDKIILVGNYMKMANQNIKLANSHNYPDSATASLEIENYLADGDICYFKGSRGIKMEVIIQKLKS